MKEAELQACHQIVKELEARGCKILERSVLHLKIQIGKLDVSISLKNIKAEIALLPNRKEALILEFVEKILSNLRFEVHNKRRFWPRILPFQEVKSLSAPWTEVLIPKKLEISIVEEMEQGLRFLQPFTFFKEGLSLKTVKQESFQNVSWAFDELEWQELEAGIWGVEDGNGLASAMVLLLRQRFATKYEMESKLEKAIIGIPTRNHLWICFDEQKLPLFELKVKQVYRQFPYPISEECIPWSSAFDKFYQGLA